MERYMTYQFVLMFVITIRMVAIIKALRGSIIFTRGDQVVSEFSGRSRQARKVLRAEQKHYTSPIRIFKCSFIFVGLGSPGTWQISRGEALENEILHRTDHRLLCGCVWPLGT